MMGETVESPSFLGPYGPVLGQAVAQDSICRPLEREPADMSPVATALALRTQSGASHFYGRQIESLGQLLAQDLLSTPQARPSQQS
jgi:hypothetical protein